MSHPRRASYQLAEKVLKKEAQKNATMTDAFLQSRIDELEKLYFINRCPTTKHTLNINIQIWEMLYGRDRVTGKVVVRNKNA